MADLLGGLFNIGGAIAGDIAGGKDRGHAQALTDEAINAVKNVNVPTNLADLINYAKYQNAGQLTPELEQALLSGPSQQGAVKADPKLLAAQMQALDAMKNMSQTGMSSADRARLNQIQQQMATQAEGQKQQVMQNYAQRGLGGSGNELLAQLQASQNAANQANQQGLQQAAQAQQASQNALAQYGNQAGQLENQQYGQQSQSAQANDLNTRFNVQAQQQQQARNVAAKNAAQNYNVQNAQNLSNANVGLGNSALNQQRQGEQQLFSDQMQRAGGISNAAFQGANSYNQMANQQAQKWSNIGSGLGNIAGGLGGASGIMNAFGGGGGGGGNASGGTYTGSYTPFSNTNAGGAGDEGGGTSDMGGMMYAAEGGTVPYGRMPPGYAQGGQVMADPSMMPRPQHPQQQPQQQFPMLGMLAAHGGKVPGTAPVHGDSYTNDKVHTLLSPGEIVIPRSISMHANAPEMARLFVENEMRKQGRK